MTNIIKNRFLRLVLWLRFRAANLPIVPAHLRAKILGDSYRMFDRGWPALSKDKTPYSIRSGVRVVSKIELDAKIQSLPDSPAKSALISMRNTCYDN